MTAATPARRRGRIAKAVPVPPAAPPPAKAPYFKTPTRHGLAAVLEHEVCESLNRVGIATDSFGWLLLPGADCETLFATAVDHLDEALRAQDAGAGFWRADLERLERGGVVSRYQMLVGDVWVTRTMAVTFRARSVELQGEVVHLKAKNSGRRVVRLLAQAAACALVLARPESMH